MSFAAQFGVTLTQHVLDKQAEHQDAKGQFSQLLTQIGVAGKLIAASVRRAGLIENLGTTGETNVQGETVEKLDRIANDTIVEVLRRSGCVAAMASEEEHDFIEVPAHMAGDYIVLFDPLDGSSNIDVNVSIGTIFAIYKRTRKDEIVKSDFLRKGREMVAAGYVIYGSSTAFVYSDSKTVDAFILDPASGEFFLTRENIRMPDKMALISTNESNEPYWPAGVDAYMANVRARNDAEKRRVSSRHIGSLVADFHRNLLKGGMFLYPANKDTGKGKLRVLYECNPLAFIAEAAGGAASNGTIPILDILPENLHDRTSLYIGPKNEVELAVKCLREAKKA